MKVGDEVTHDFSGGLGVIVKIDHTSNYPYYVEWYDDEHKGRQDWYKKEVLMITKRAKESSTQL